MNQETSNALFILTDYVDINALSEGDLLALKNAFSGVFKRGEPVRNYDLIIGLAGREDPKDLSQSTYEVPFLVSDSEAQTQRRMIEMLIRGKGPRFLVREPEGERVLYEAMKRNGGPGPIRLEPTNCHAIDFERLSKAISASDKGRIERYLSC